MTKTLKKKNQMRAAESQGVEKPKSESTDHFYALPRIMCPTCGGLVFQPAITIYQLSRLHPKNTTGEDQFPMHPVHVCMGRIAVQQVNPENPEEIMHVEYMPCGRIIDLNNPKTYTLK